MRQHNMSISQTLFAWCWRNAQCTLASNNACRCKDISGRNWDSSASICFIKFAHNDEGSLSKMRSVQRIRNEEADRRKEKKAKTSIVRFNKPNRKRGRKQGWQIEQRGKDFAVFQFVSGVKFIDITGRKKMSKIDMKKSVLWRGRRTWY